MNDKASFTQIKNCAHPLHEKMSQTKNWKIQGTQGYHDTSSLFFSMEVVIGMRVVSWRVKVDADEHRSELHFGFVKFFVDFVFHFRFIYLVSIMLL